MRKRLIEETRQATSTSDEGWLDLEDLVEVEISSEDAAHPIELALAHGEHAGWRAAVSGKQEYVLRWSADKGKTYREFVRQQWNFNPQGASAEIEEHQVELSGVTVLELVITPEIGGGDAVASLARLRIA